MKELTIEFFPAMAEIISVKTSDATRARAGNFKLHISPVQLPQLEMENFK